MIGVALGLALCCFLLAKRKNRKPREVTAKTVMHLMQTPEHDAPRYRRTAGRRKFRNDGKP